MLTLVRNLVINQGATFSKTFNFVDESNNKFDLTGYTVKAQIRKHYRANKFINFTASVNSPSTDGKVTLILTDLVSKSLESGRYVYDLVATKTSTSEKIRLLEGLITVSDGVTF